ncbi:Hypothetical protein PENO1_096550 [Penicillium occitanis (nom. inval.)]|nr:Hypothetical protein PENO1_096550 [Penicillium occitanis (nom. inval.)]PCG91374.1 hypothetical protein PENOC_097700 [Penicillium occitanis (nom. inval.)]
MPLSALTKHHLRQSDDSLPLTCISQCRDQPPPPPPSDGEHALPLKEVPILANNSSSNNSNFTIGGSWITKSISRHSSSSSAYSSSAETTNNPKRQYTMTTTNSEMSARSSIVSQSQESAKSMNSSVGVTSKRRSEGIKQVLSFSSLRKRESVDKNPFKWLCRRSDAGIRHSTSQLKLEQQMESEDHSGGLGPGKDVETQQQQPQVLSPDLGPVIVQRMDRLEEKIDIFFSGLSSASRSTTNSTDLEPGDPITIKETPQTPYINPQTDNDIKSHLKILTAEIAHLTKSNNNLSSCIDALGSSGLIDLLEMLSCSLENLHAIINSLREEQKQRQQQLQTIINPDQELQDKQLESQMDLIQRLGFLLGQREEQLRHERRLNQTYRRNIEGLEEMIRSLEEEWERAMPVMARSDVHVERVGDAIKRLSRGKAE